MLRLRSIDRKVVALFYHYALRLLQSHYMTYEGSSTIQLFRERLSYKRGKTNATRSKVFMGNGDFTVALLKLKVFQRWKETAQTREFKISPFVLLNHLEPQSSNAKLLLPIIPIGIVAYAFTLL